MKGQPMSTILDFQIQPLSAASYSLTVCARGSAPPLATSTFQLRVSITIPSNTPTLNDGRTGFFPAPTSFWRTLAESAPWKSGRITPCWIMERIGIGSLFSSVQSSSFSLIFSFSKHTLKREL